MGEQEGVTYIYVVISSGSPYVEVFSAYCMSMGLFQEPSPPNKAGGIPQIHKLKHGGLTHTRCPPCVSQGGHDGKRRSIPIATPGPTVPHVCAKLQTKLHLHHVTRIQTMIREARSLWAILVMMRKEDLMSVWYAMEWVRWAHL